MAYTNQTLDYHSDAVVDNSTQQVSKQGTVYSENQSLLNTDVTTSSGFDNGLLTNGSNYNTNDTVLDYESENVINQTLIPAYDCFGETCSQSSIRDGK